MKKDKEKKKNKKVYDIGTFVHKYLACMGLSDKKKRKNQQGIK